MTHFVPPGEELGYAFEKTVSKKKSSDTKRNISEKEGL